MASSGGSFGFLRLLSHTQYVNENPKSIPLFPSNVDPGNDSVSHSHSHQSHPPPPVGSAFSAVALSSQESEPDTSTSAGGDSGNGVTTLELHPNVILGIGDDEDQGAEPNRPHSCSICHASYKTRTHLRRHMFVHMSNRPFPCQDCGKGFNRREHLNKHMEAVHSPNKHHCPYCNKEISRLDHLKRHIKNMHTEKPKSEPVDKGAILKVEMACGQRQKAQISFLSPHFPSGTVGQTIITPIPLTGSSHDRDQSTLKSKSEPSSSDSTDQIIEVEDDSPPSMTIIPSNILGPGQGVATLSIQNTPTQKLLIHQRLPSGSEMNVATATNGLASLANLNLSLGGHSHSDTEDKKVLLQIYNCGQCSSTFTTEKDLALHARSHKPQPHRCPECPRAYTRREKLTEHIRCVHHGQKFGCEYCGKKLSRKDHVLRHIRSVHPEVYAASFAEVPFRIPQHLKNMDDGYITLDKHGKLISSRNSLPLVSPSRKRKKHSDGETVIGIPAIGDVGVLLRSVCQVCLKVFGTAYHLTRHVESCHSGDVRPFSCTACNKMFKRKDHLTKHVKSHCPSLKEAIHPSPSQFSSLHNDSEKTSTSLSPHSPSSSKGAKITILHRQETKNEERESGLGTMSEGSVSSDCHHALLQNLQVEIDTSRRENVESQHGINPGRGNIENTTLLVDGNQHKHSDHSEFSLAGIDSFMQGNVNVVVVDEDISNFLQQTSNSHLTTTFPCGQCQKEFTARDQLIAHLQEHASDSVLPSGQHISDVTFAHF